MARKSIAPSKASPGMVLAKPVIDEQGRTLCGEGTKLTTRLIGRFDQMGITALVVQTDERMTAEDYEAARNTIETRFINIANGSMLGHLRDIMFERLDEKRKGQQ